MLVQHQRSNFTYLYFRQVEISNVNLHNFFHFIDKPLTSPLFKQFNLLFAQVTFVIFLKDGLYPHSIDFIISSTVKTQSL